MYAFVIFFYQINSTNINVKEKLSWVDLDKIMKEDVFEQSPILESQRPLRPLFQPKRMH
jgi:hypothetical protein